MESLNDNKPLRNVLLFTEGIVVLAATEIISSFNEYLQLVPFPHGVIKKIIASLFLEQFI